MVDVEIFGLRAGAHHLVNLILHILVSCLLYLFLLSTTQASGKSVFIAAMFAVHPLHVESVAWISERKDLLCGLFFLLALLAYETYAKRPDRKRYTAVFLLTAAALMSKQTAVTLPLVFLLLDFWPLRRWPGEGQRGFDKAKTIKRLLLEKIPLLALSIAAAGIAFLSQSGGGATGVSGAYPVWMRFQNGLLSYGKYLWKSIFPTGLAVFYPYPRSFSFFDILLSALLITALTVAVIKWRRRFPFLLSGWMWFLITLLPVIGIIQIGRQAMADRYMYLPLIGLLIIAAWGFPSLIKGLFPRFSPGATKTAMMALSLSLVLFAGATARRQTSFWKDGVTLFQHALAVTKTNGVMHAKLALAFMDEGRDKEAIAQYRESLRIDPLSYEAHNNLGNLLLRSGLVEEAVPHYREAAKLGSGFAEPRNNLGVALNRMGRTAEAELQFLEALALREEYPEAHHNLAAVYAKAGKIEEAIRHDSRAVELNPGFADAYRNLAVSLFRKGEYRRAMAAAENCIKSGGTLPGSFLEALKERLSR